MLALILAFHMQAFAQGVSLESLQLQQLIDKSEQQIRTAKELLNYSKQDTASLEKAAAILEKLSAGIDKSIKKYQGTKAYEKALLEIQSKDDFERPQYDARRPDAKDPHSKAFDNFIKFQHQSVSANLSDLSNQEKLEQALQSAEQGFVPKIQTQAQLGSWQANTRISAQLAELLSTLHALREDLLAKDQNSSGMAALLSGSEIQNQKQRKGALRAP
jgi:hypothetical protein